MKIDHVYIITLDLSEDNRADIISRLETVGFPYQVGYTIFEGVNGLKTIKHRDNIDKFGFQLYDNWVFEDYQNDKFDWWGRKMSVGEIGCVISHISVWEDAYLNNYEYVLILEDDFDITELEKPWFIFDELNGYDYDIIMFDTNLVDYPNNENKNIGLEHFIEPGFSYNAHAYILNKNSIKKINECYLDILKKNLIPTDEFLPAIFSNHPRPDIRFLFDRNLKAVRPKQQYVEFFFIQTRNDHFGMSTTNPVEGVDF